MIKCIGYIRKSGNFKDDSGKSIDYDNIILYLISDENDGVVGFESTQLKIKAASFEKLCPGLYSVNDLLDQTISLDYSLFSDKPVLRSISIIPTK